MDRFRQGIPDRVPRREPHPTRKEAKVVPNVSTVDLPNFGTFFEPFREFTAAP